MGLYVFFFNWADYSQLIKNADLNLRISFIEWDFPTSDLVVLYFYSVWAHFCTGGRRTSAVRLRRRSIPCLLRIYYWQWIGY